MSTIRKWKHGDSCWDELNIPWRAFADSPKKVQVSNQRARIGAIAFVKLVFVSCKVPLNVVIRVWLSIQRHICTLCSCRRFWATWQSHAFARETCKQLSTGQSCRASSGEAPLCTYHVCCEPPPYSQEGLLKPSNFFVACDASPALKLSCRPFAGGPCLPLLSKDPSTFDLDRVRTESRPSLDRVSTESRLSGTALRNWSFDSLLGTGLLEGHSLLEASERLIRRDPSPIIDDRSRAKGPWPLHSTCRKAGYEIPFYTVTHTHNSGYNFRLRSPRMAASQFPLVPRCRRSSTLCPALVVPARRLRLAKELAPDSGVSCHCKSKT